MLHSNYFRDELIESASSITDKYGDKDLPKALAKLDWKMAGPLLESMASASQPDSIQTALSLLYEHALEKNDVMQIENYRGRLKEIVTDPPESSLWRGIALGSLMATEWRGQEEWFLSLFNDPVLAGLIEKPIEPQRYDHHGFALTKRLIRSQTDPRNRLSSNQLVIPLRGNPERWIPVIAKLIGNNRALHDAAVSCLNDYATDRQGDIRLRREAARPLLPWLTDANWSSAPMRAAFIDHFGDLELPESILGLIWILDNDESDAARVAAANALRAYRDPRAVPALRRALEREEHEDYRENIVMALAFSGGFPDEEMAAAIEAYARMISTSEGEKEVDLSTYGESGKPLPLEVSIGRIINQYRWIEVLATEGVAERLFARVEELRLNQPEVAKRILEMIRAVPLHIAYVKLIERISEGTADVDDLALALKNRDPLQANVAGELYALFKREGYFSGIAAALLSDRSGMNDLLEGNDSKAKLALLACARYLRENLEIDSVARLLNGPDRKLARAAENYLEVEDGPEARRLIIAKHRGEAFFLADIYRLATDVGMLDELRWWEEELRSEVLKPGGVDEIYACVSLENLQGMVIRVKRGKAELTLVGWNEQRKVRNLAADEFQELKDFTSRQDVEDLGPQSWEEVAYFDKPCYMYLRLSRKSGRRIMLDQFDHTPKKPTLHEELSGIFYRLNMGGEFEER
jgi:hypothetical protein